MKYPDYNSLPLAEGRLQLLWANNWWDGALGGMCIYNDEKYYFDFNEEEEITDGVSTYHYILFKLTPEQLAYEEARHQCFVEHIGCHYEYLPTNKRKGTGNGNLKSEAEWNKYREKYPEPSKYEFSPEQAVFRCSDRDNF